MIFRYSFIDDDVHINVSGNYDWGMGNVWQEIDIKPCKVPDFFIDTSSV